MRSSNNKNNRPKRASAFRLKYLLYDMIKWSAALSTLIALRPKLYYVGARVKKLVKGAALVISNHESYLDIIKLHLAFWNRRLHFVATSQLFATKRGDWFFRRALCIPVDKQNFNVQTFREVCDRLNEGSVVAIFPEGSINREGAPMNAFKSGVVLMALKSGAPIIPVYLDHPKHWYNMQRIVIGEPIEVPLCDGAMPPLREVERITVALRERELELAGHLHAIDARKRARRQKRQNKKEK